jgi:anti-sigma regulatory factor (Ser/Thr protein kinase)
MAMGGRGAAPGPRAGDVDGLAVAALRALVDLPGVVRAGIALSVPGGRELRFLPSDPEKLSSSPPRWCLVDAFDRLPLNDAVRTGRRVVYGTPDAVTSAYPDLTLTQAGHEVSSVIAVPLDLAGERLGGLLAYSTRRITGPDDDVVVRAEELAASVSLAVGAARRTGGAWPEAATPEQGFALPADATAPSVARHHLVDALAELGVADDDTLDAALLCATELVTNVVMHTGMPSVLSLERTDDALTVRIQHPTGRHQGPIARVSDPDPLRISGHGLELVEALSSSWGSEGDSEVTTTWYRLAL